MPPAPDPKQHIVQAALSAARSSWQRNEEIWLDETFCLRCEGAFVRLYRHGYKPGCSIFFQDPVKGWRPTGRATESIRDWLAGYQPTITLDITKIDDEYAMRHLSS